MALNLNVGILGHVDSGKTTLAKCLSQIASTAAFDKNPQSQSRGITLDLGFSSFSIQTPSHLRNDITVEKLQYTLVDCPGHASLIKTVIGGAQIIDMILLVIDITKGIQTQTAECIVIGEITCKKMIIVLNKIDLVALDKRDHILEKVKKKIKTALSNTIFNDSPIVAISVNPTGNREGLSNLIDQISEYSFVPKRQLSGTFLFAVDHCFSIRGQGTVLTGTVLSGCASVNDIIDIPTIAIERKIKSIQIFKQPIARISQGDRAGICVTQFDSKQFERGLICSPKAAKFIHCGIIALNRIKYFKYAINSHTKFHVTVGYETTLGSVILFAGKTDSNIDFNEDFKYIDNLKPISEETDEIENCFALIEFEKPVLTTDNALVICSKLDVNISINTCRIAFWGNLLHYCKEKDYKSSFLPKLKLFKIKTKVGSIERIISEDTVIVKNMFKKETSLEKFIGLKVKNSFDELGRIDSAFGKSGKIK
ncbi:50S ribosome-binding GTPase, partial [Oryctes borbonicus]